MLTRLLVALGLVAAVAAPSAQTDLDAFMARVLARRDDNWKKLQQYVLEERERLRIEGGNGVPLYGFEREYSWFVRDGIFVRSPVRADGVAVDEAERRREEGRWLRRRSGHLQRLPLLEHVLLKLLPVLVAPRQHARHQGIQVRLRGHRRCAD